MVPFTAAEYNRYGLPWFDYYSDNSKPLKGSAKLKGLKSVLEMGKINGDKPLPERRKCGAGKDREAAQGTEEGTGSGRGVLSGN